MNYDFVLFCFMLGTFMLFAFWLGVKAGSKEQLTQNNFPEKIISIEEMEAESEEEVEREWQKLRNE